MVDKNNEHIQAIAEYVTKEGLHYFGAELEYIETGEAFAITVAKESALRKLTEENARLREALEASTCAFESFYNLDDNDVDPMHYGEYQAVSGIVSRNKQLLKGDEDE